MVKWLFDWIEKWFDGVIERIEKEEECYGLKIRKEIKEEVSYFLKGIVSGFWCDLNSLVEGGVD